MRTFQPNAQRVSLISDSGESPGKMRRVHAAGIFSATLPAGASGYRFSVTTSSGDTVEFDDPYRFETQIGELDMHLFGEGEHRDLYHRLGARATTVHGVPGTHFAVWAPSASRVSVITVRRAYEELERAGVIATRQGKGSVVAERGDLPTVLMHEELQRQLEALLACAARLGLAHDELHRLLDQAADANAADNTTRKGPTP